ncbi:TetR/AcrR family transcriptional regulator [Nocardia aurantiaca]|uniref:TetR/AcrR family transcriptional regulator n=1 Tax=Nocardia aurantiaca TaxID=2675850 RepID=UPI0018A9969E|nr:TetR/AcrR family transcriptional regulator [Nocardia aurantiaca]
MGTERPNSTPRRDVTRNRGRILAAARRVYRENGATAPNDVIIAAAQVGLSTFYRHFPTRSDLHRALMDELVTAATEIAERADNTEDPWTAFSDVFRHGCVLDDADLALFHNLAAGTPELAAHAAELTARIVTPSLNRAQSAGLLPATLDTDTVVDLMTAAHTAPTAERRDIRASVMLAGLRHPRPV